MRKGYAGRPLDPGKSMCKTYHVRRAQGNRAFSVRLFGSRVLSSRASGREGQAIRRTLETLPAAEIYEKRLYTVFFSKTV